MHVGAVTEDTAGGDVVAPGEYYSDRKAGDDDNDPRYNGGKSVVKIRHGQWLEYTFTPPILKNRW